MLLIEKNENSCAVLTCTVCGISKTIENFYKQPQSKSGRLGKCIACYNKERGIIPVRDRLKAQKVCSMCGIDKNISEYYPSRSHPNGARTHCKACQAIKGATNEYREKCNARAKIVRSIDHRKAMFRSARGRAMQKGIEFSITLSDIYMPPTCPILGTAFVIGNGVPLNESPSLDRINPALGYIPGNVAVISHRANMIKNNAVRSELQAIINYLDSYANVKLGQTNTELRIFEPISSEIVNSKVTRPIPFRNSADENRTLTQKESL